MGPEETPLTPEQQEQEEQLRQQQMMAAALRGEQMRAQQQQRDSEVYSSIGSSLSGYGSRAIDSLAANASRRGEGLLHSSGQANQNALGLLEALARRRAAMSPEMEAALIAEKQARAKYLARPPGGKDTTFGDTTGLRKEVGNLPETKALQEVESQFNQMSNAADNATGDVARIYALAKIYDPGGRVTDSDYNAAKQGQGPLARLQGLVNEVEGQGMLSAQSRKNMLEMARKLYEKRKTDYAARAKTFEGIAKKRGLDPSEVVIRPTSDGRAGGDIDLSGGLDAAKKARLEELRKKKAAGALK